MDDRNTRLQMLHMMSQLVASIRDPRMLEQVQKDMKTLANSQEEQKLLKEIMLQIEEVQGQMENMVWLNKHYRILHEFAQACSKTLHEATLLQKAYEMVSRVMSADSFFIALYEEGNKFIQYVILMDNGKAVPKKVYLFGENYSSTAIRERKTVHLQSKMDPEDKRYSFGEKETSSCLFVPIIIDGHVKAVISAQSYSDFAYRKEDEELLQIIGTQVIHSIETARSYKRIYIMSQTDELTGLKNHRAFHEDLSRYMQEKRTHIALMMIDSDNLKKINDSYGHDLGDIYLQTLANGITSICGKYIEGYRYAGDEFMLILTASCEPEAVYAELKNYYQHHPIQVTDRQIVVSVSAGVAKYPHDGATVDSLKKSADKALYVAKKRNGNCLVVRGE